MQHFELNAEELQNHQLIITRQTFRVRGDEWKPLCKEDGQALFCQESYPVLRDAQGTPIGSEGITSTRVELGAW